ncbi:MAG: monothiol glutaredoxin, Grx4 family [Oceanospirillaceae bacterium]|nr:monothiol glutaredoxin, Grx4 family [Oceanospirillaceae bacterium]|tara:strand:+ start:191 stop:526 length:336 start_codon:yes stop_codon:yes gene_type:complete
MNKPDVPEIIRQQIASQSVLIYMKGSPDAPECGFSAAAIKALRAAGAEDFAFVNVLTNPSIRERLPAVSGWPTFPQLFIQGELIGGSDIVVNMAADGSLKQALASIDEAEA